MVNQNLEFTIGAIDAGASAVAQEILKNLDVLSIQGSADFAKLNVATQQAGLQFAKAAVQLELLTAEAKTPAFDKLKANLAQINVALKALEVNKAAENLIATGNAANMAASSFDRAAASLAAVRAENTAAAATFIEFGSAADAAAAGMVVLVDAEERSLAAQVESAPIIAAAIAQMDDLAAANLNAARAALARGEAQLTSDAKMVGQGIVQAGGGALAVPIAVGGTLLAADLATAGDKLTKFGTIARQQGMNISVGLGLPIAAIGGLSLIASTQYEAAMAQIQSQTGGTAGEVKIMTAAMLELAQTSSQTPTQLGKALFYIESVGIRGTAAIETMKAATMGAVAGQADLTEVTKALAAAQVSQVDGTKDAMTTMGTLNAIVEHGRLNMDDLAGAMSTGILAASKNFGVNLTDMGAALVVLTNSGVEANSAATRLRMTFSLLSAPTAKATAILKELGLGALDIAHAIRSGGLSAGIELLKNKLDEFTNDPALKADLLSQAFGGGRSSTTLITLINQLDQLKQAQIDVGRDSGRLASDYANMTDTFLFKWKSFVANVQVDAIKLGDAFKPIAENLFKILPVIDSIAGSFAKLPAPVKEFLLAVAGFAIIAGPLMIFIGAIASMVGWMIKAVSVGLAFQASLTGTAAAATEVAGAEGTATAATLTLSSAMATLGLYLVLAFAEFEAINLVVQHFTGAGIISWLTGAEMHSRLAADATKKYGDALTQVQELTRAGVSDEQARGTVFERTKSNISEVAKELQGLKAPSSGWMDWGKTIGDSVRILSGDVTAFKTVWDDLSKTFSSNSWEKASADVNRLAQSFADLGLSYRQYQSLILDDKGNITPIGAKLLENKDFRKGFDLVSLMFKESEAAALEWTNKIVTSSGLASSAIVEEYTLMADAVDAYAKSVKAAADAFTPKAESDPILAELQLRIDKAEELKLRLGGDWTKEMQAGLDTANAQLSGYMAAWKIVSDEIILFGANYRSLFSDVSSITAAATDVENLRIAISALPVETQLKVSAQLSMLKMDELKQFFDQWDGKTLTIGVVLSGIEAARETINALVAGGGPMNMATAFEAAARGTPGIFATAPPAVNPEIYHPQPDKGKEDKLNKTEFGLLELAAAFKVFNTITGSESIPAFKAWLEMQKKLTDGTDAMAVRMEEATNPTYSLIMALGAIAAHVREANETIGTFLRDEVYKPALNAFKSALSALFSEPTKEGQALQLRLLQLQRQRLLDTGNKKALEKDDKAIEQVQHQIDLLTNQNAIIKLQNEMKDKTVKSEQDVITAANTLGDMISQSSAKVNQFADGAFFLTLTAINLGNSFNELAAQNRAGLGGANLALLAGHTDAELAAWFGASGKAAGGPAGGWTMLGEYGPELVRLPQSSYVYNNRQTKSMMQGGGYGDININLTLQGASKQHIKDEVMKALDDALVGASFGGSYIGSGAYSPNG